MSTKQELIQSVQKLREEVTREFAKKCDSLIVEIYDMPEVTTRLPETFTAEGPQLPRSGHLEIGEILEYLKISRSTFYRHIKAGILPQPEKYGENTRTSRWDAVKLWACLEKTECK